MVDILSMDLTELKGFIKEIGQPEYRAKQIYGWLHKKFAVSFDDMNNIPGILKQNLGEKAVIKGVKTVDRLVSQKDGTIKYLFALDNNSIIESVFMKYSFGNAVCVSTQAGCRMGCTFCASTVNGVERSLSAGEILSQVYTIQKDTGERVSSIVLMGSGEPLDNYENVIKFISIINSKEGLDIGQRHITLSTCGITDKIRELAELKLQITLAVSLHAPNDEIRNRIMPISKKYDYDSLMDACRYYYGRTGRRITFEYALIKDVNDSRKCASELASRLKKTNMLCHVNLIPVNGVKERNYEKSSTRTIEEFAEILTERGIETTVRRKLGSDINAACGQLRRRYMADNSKETL